MVGENYVEYVCKWAIYNPQEFYTKFEEFCGGFAKSVLALLWS